MTTLLALEPGFFPTVGRGVGAITLYAVIGVALLLIGFFAVDLSTPGKLNELVRAGAPNAVAVTAAGLVSMAFIVVLAIFSSGGKLAEGVIATLIYGLVGIIVQVLAVRLLEWVGRIDIGSCLAAERFAPVTWVVCAGHVALGLVVAVAIL